MRAQSVTETIVTAITADITHGRLLPGTQLSEVALAHDHGVSRNTLREAFRMLAHRGLVEHVPYRGVFVRRMTEDDLKDLYNYRRFIELGAVQRAHTNPEVTARCLEHMRAACDNAHAAVDRGNWIEVGTANSAFHQAIIDLVDSPRLSSDGRIALAQARLVFLAHPVGRDIHGPFVADNLRIFELIDAAKITAAHDALGEYLHRAEAVNLQLAASATS